MESSNDMGNRMPEMTGFMRRSGIQSVIALVYSISPKHTDAYYARKAREAARLRPDVIYLKDPAGLLTPERTRTIVPGILAGAGKVPVEIHSHCTTGLAPLCYLEAIKLGIRVVHTGIPPLANGAAQPSVFNVAKNARALGFHPTVNLDRLPEVKRRIDALDEIRRREDYAPLAVTFKRVANIVPPGFEGEVSAALCSNPVELDLARAVTAARADVDALLLGRDYRGALGRIAELRPVVDRFFDGVMVLADDPKVRNNRLALLAAVASLFANLADFKQLG
jgi:hypothetical protein